MAEATKDELDMDSPSDGLTYSERAKANGMRYTLADVPPWYMTAILGVQHYFVFLGATVLIPLIVTPPMGANPKQTAEVISTIFFVTGLNTLVQTTIGDRLPIVQGGSFAFLTPTFSIIFNPELQAIEDPSERFYETMQILSGAILVMGVVQTVIGYTGIMVPILQFISPVTIAPVIAVLGLSLYNIGFSNVATCFSMGFTQMGLTILFAMYLKNFKIGGFAVFALFPVILALSMTWSLAAILTATDVFEEGSACRTDSTRDIVSQMPFFRFPYPGQWGGLKFRTWAIIPMFGAMIASMVESIGDYYSCARLSGAPPPTPGIVSRGLGGEGIGVFLAGLFGSSSGTTSYSENIGAISLTRVGSRVVVQCAALTSMVIGILGKFSAALASLPSAIVGGVYCIVFGLLVAVGLSNLQYVNLNNERNLFIIGFALFNALSVAGPSGYFASQETNPFGSGNAAEIGRAFFSSPLIIALLSALIMDNTIPGATKEDRGLQVWDKVKSADIHNDPEYIRAYALPPGLAQIFGNCGYLEYFGRGFTLPPPPADGKYQAGQGGLAQLCCPSLCGPSQVESEVPTALEETAKPSKVMVDRGEVDFEGGDIEEEVA